MGERQSFGVALPQGQSGSSYLHQVLARAVEAYPEALAQAHFPHDFESFKAGYGTALARFELCRAASEQRSEIARFVVTDTQKGLRYVDEEGERDLGERMGESVAPLPLETVPLPATPGWRPGVRFRGRLYDGPQVAQLVDEWHERHFMTQAAAQALRRVLERSRREGGLSMRGERVVVLGAAAELAPTVALLKAGADVLWIDVRDPRAEMLVDRQLAGQLHFVRGGADLLAQPRAIAATISEFAGEAGAHVWMYAYAGGASQEWRLTSSMNAIVRSLPTEQVRSVATLISPTTPGVVSAEDQHEAQRRLESAAGWKRALARAGRLVPGQLGDNGVRVSHSIVPTQGVSYQAAQYVGKMLAAETYAVFGHRLDTVRSEGLLTSANVAPITATRSLSHPVFEAAFLGAPMFDIAISEPPTTRVLSGLLTLHDMLYPPPATSETERSRSLFSKQIHGGVYAQPYALQGCITVAALRGLGKRPRLVAGLLR